MPRPVVNACCVGYGLPAKYPCTVNRFWSSEARPASSYAMKLTPLASFFCTVNARVTSNLPAVALGTAVSVVRFILNLLFVFASW